MADTLKDYVNYLVDAYFEVDGIDIATDLSSYDIFKLAALLFDRDGKNLAICVSEAPIDLYDRTRESLYLNLLSSNPHILNDNFSLRIFICEFYMKEMQQLLDDAHTEELANRDIADNLNRLMGGL